ncbi:MAG TPA: hypothetical protein VMK12_14255 [Anaeromyxobacteraceae bacterium]|nr:hypothetical protein [Anaeromyxobacteraceae bacterium]
MIHCRLGSRPSFLIATLAVLLPSLGTADNGSACRSTGEEPGCRRTFTVAVIPDSQNYLDFTHQTAQGFPFDASTILDQQIQYVADNAMGSGGSIAFLSDVGDTWQHQSLDIDPDSVAKGYSAIYNPWFSPTLAPSPLTRSVELPGAVAAYSRIAGKLTFSAVPGNHDYDAQYSDSRWPPTTDPAKVNMNDPNSVGELHIGGLTNFRDVFGMASSFFKDKRWYVSSHNGGADSAQIFWGGGYAFLHIGLEMDAPADALEWASETIARFPGLPTIVTTHDYLNTDASRTPNPIIDPKLTDPSHNDPQDVWDQFISKNDQIFMVLCGHEHGEAFRVDDNSSGHAVYQILADYQDRTQVSVERGVAQPTTLGDGWMRLMYFDMDAGVPRVHVRTYSTYYEAYSTDLPQYVSWYKTSEAPTLPDDQYLAKGDFSIDLTDFRQRFGNGM